MSIDQKSKISFTIYCQSFLQIKELTKLEKFFAPILEKKNNFRESSFSKLKKAVSELKLNKPSQIISVTGTNGKGSTLEILSQVLSNNNYKVGLFTSPHLIKFNERIKINIYVKDRRLRADALSVSVFRELRVSEEWTKAEVNAETAKLVEASILTKARELRIGSLGNS